MQVIVDKSRADTHLEYADHGKTEPPRADQAACFAAFEKELTFWRTVSIYWRACLWSLYSMLLVFNFGVDGIIAGLTVCKYRT